MTSTRLAALLTVFCLAAAAAGARPAASLLDDVTAAREALTQAQAQGEAARVRAERLEAEASRASEVADRTARESAALAARIQQNEATIAGLEAQGRLIERDRRILRARLAARQQPLVRLSAALQRLARRPPVLALLRPGSIRDTMYMRALLATMLPQVEQRTAELRAELAQGRALQARATRATVQLRAGEARLGEQRAALLALETQQRLASRQVTSLADREAERALALAEEARDLGALVSEVGVAGRLRDALAALPGPVRRPAQPGATAVADGIPESTAAASDLGAYMLPVSGRLVSGFGDAREGAAPSRGITLATRQGAQIVAPAPGRVAFAGPFRGYGLIVIVEHPGGWTSLVTGLARLDTRVGADLGEGSPIGIAGSGDPRVTLELRRDGEPVNPLEYLRAR